MLGSQSCEKVFRSARSMTSTFSTVINFSLLGLLRRLHRLHIIQCLESESDDTGVKYPRAEAHKKKDGKNVMSSCSSKCSEVSNEDILKAVMRGKEAAQDTAEVLGMAPLLRSLKCWDNPPIPTSSDCQLQTEVNDDDDDDEEGEDAGYESLNEVDSYTFTSEVEELTSAGVIDKNLSSKLKLLKRPCYRQTETSTIPLYEAEYDKEKKVKHNTYIEVVHNGKKSFIRKSTAVWLLQEGERVSTDRLFRVRSNQPYNTEQHIRNEECTRACLPVVCETVEIGNICAFLTSSPMHWSLGRILEFSFYLEKTAKSRQYVGRTVSLLASSKPEKVGVLCSWYDNVANTRTFSLNYTQVNSDKGAHYHFFHPVKNYLCTLAYSCFEVDTKVELKKRGIESSLLGGNDNSVLTTTQELTLTDEAITFISNILSNRQVVLDKQSAAVDNKIAVHTKHKTAALGSKLWVTHGNVHLSKKDHSEIINGKQLSDLHINAYQSLLKIRYSSIFGFQDTLLQNKTSITKHGCLSGHTLQIMHIQGCHWAVLQVKDGVIQLYDTSFTTATKETLHTISQLLRCKTSTLEVQMMNVAKQSGMLDCGLYAAAIITSLAMGNDPLDVVFNQRELRQHFSDILVSGVPTLFPVLKRRRITNRILRIESCNLYCFCRLPENEEDMICCDSCEEWYHYSCLKDVPQNPSNSIWFCETCKTKQ